MDDHIIFIGIDQPLTFFSSFQLQISYSAGSPALGDRKKYKTLFRTIPSDFNYNPARVAIMKHFNWSRVAVLFQTERSNYFSLVSLQLVIVVLKYFILLLIL